MIEFKYNDDMAERLTWRWIDKPTLSAGIKIHYMFDWRLHMPYSVENVDTPGCAADIQGSFDLDFGRDDAAGSDFDFFACSALFHFWYLKLIPK